MSFHAQHEIRIGTRQLWVFACAALVICGLTFVLGILVGREMGGASGGGVRAGASAAAGSADKAGRGGRPERAASEERLTFYQTLTAPTPTAPVVAPPVVEERIVQDAPALPKPARKAERRPAVVEPTASRAAAARAPGAMAAPAVPSVAPAPSQGVSSEPPLWTVQVSSFRSRSLAEELRARLASRGFDVYLVSTATEDGRVRHRVRVGSFAAKVDAERVATELRGERNLNPFVTSRAR